jgi:hypothetical protein
MRLRAIVLAATPISLLLTFFSVVEVFYNIDNFWLRLLIAFIGGGSIPFLVDDLRDMILCMILTFSLTVVQLIIFWMLPAIFGLLYPSTVVNLLTYQVGGEVVNFLLVKPIPFGLGLMCASLLKNR